MAGLTVSILMAANTSSGLPRRYWRPHFATRLGGAVFLERNTLTATRGNEKPRLDGDQRAGANQESAFR
jgi:hypothetical protein